MSEVSHAGLREFLLILPAARGPNPL